MKEMTIKEVITEYALELYKKTYKNVYGNEIDEMLLDFNSKVKDVYINFRNKTVIFTVLDNEEEN